jgi:DUF971 family protein
MQATTIKLRQKERQVEIHFDNGAHFVLSCEDLRIHSPSAEVQGHGGQGGTVPVNKAQVNIDAIEPVGHYAVKFVFDDGHQSGLYTWDYLYQLGQRLSRV